MSESRTYSLATVVTVGIALLLGGLGGGLMISEVRTTSAVVQQIQAKDAGQARLVEQHQKALVLQAQVIKRHQEQLAAHQKSLQAIAKDATARFVAAETRLGAIERAMQGEAGPKEPKLK